MADKKLEQIMSRVYGVQRGTVSPKSLISLITRLYSKNRGVTKKYGGKINKKKK
jgi:hypothetical protein